MAQVTFAQQAFNGGSLSKRLRARRDQSIYKIGVKDMVGFAPMVEGGAEAMLGTVYVNQAKGPCRLFRFEYNVTQGHVIEASANTFRVFTNDVRIDVDGDPVEIVTPWDWNAVQTLRAYHSFDVMYCFHAEYQTQLFVRDGATSFHLEPLILENGPFDDRNTDKSLTVKATALSGDVTLEASAALFAASDVGSLFQMEAEDFGDIPAWENGVNVSAGTLRVANERVYQALTSGYTGGVQPNHTEGVEWDGNAYGADLNGHTWGVQWQYVHDRYGICKITGFTDATHVSATVVRHLPFSTVSGNYNSGGGYYGGDVWVPPTESVDYQYGTWRWRFGAFSNTRGWPEGGCIWKERLCLFKGARIYASVAADLTNFATWNENGDISADMAFVRTVNDPNRIAALLPAEHLVVYTAAGVSMLVPENTAAALGPSNAKLRHVNNAGSGTHQPALLDNRTAYIDRNAIRIYELDLDPQRAPQSPVDLTRYARHIASGNRGFINMAMQTQPMNFIWAVRADGTLALAVYVDEEQVLGWAERPLPEGVLARDIASITDPTGKFDQIWIAAEWNGSWHILRMTRWREDSENGDNRVMTDMSAIYDGAPTTTFTAAHLAGRTVQVVADARRFYEMQADESGAVTLPEAAQTIIMGLAYPAYMESLCFEAGGDSGPAQSKMARIVGPWLEVADTRGLAFGAPGMVRDIEELTDGDIVEQGWGGVDGFIRADSASDHTRYPRLRVERRAPFAATVLAWGGSMETQAR